MHFTTSTDYDLITWILTNPKCYAAMPPDDAPPAREFRVGPMEGVRWVIGWVGAVPICTVMLVRKHKKAHMHFCITPRAWGKANEIAERFLGWLWKADKQLRELIALVPSYNRMAIRMANRAGFRLDGIEPSDNTKHGKRFDMYHFAMTRPRGLAT